MSAECATPCASFFSTDIDTAQNWLRRLWNGWRSCWRCCRNSVHLGSTPAPCSSCTMLAAAGRALLCLLIQLLRRQLVTRTCWWDGRRILRHLSAEVVYTSRQHCRQLHIIHMSTFEWLTLLMQRITAFFRTKPLTSAPTTAICSALRTWSSCLRRSCTVRTTARSAMPPPPPLTTAPLQFCRFVKLRFMFLRRNLYIVSRWRTFCVCIVILAANIPSGVCPLQVILSLYDGDVLRRIVF